MWEFYVNCLGALCECDGNTMARLWGIPLGVLWEYYGNALGINLEGSIGVLWECGMWEWHVGIRQAYHKHTLGIAWE